jgi:hypothetical protein
MLPSLVLCLTLATVLPPADLAAAGEAGLRAIRGEALSAHIRFLADDALEGRGTGTRGHAIAVRYVATQLQSLGFEPAGDGGGWFQKVPLVGMTVDARRSSLEIDGERLRYPGDVLVTPRPGVKAEDVRGELVFVGYGITAPQYGYDDLPADLTGKIAVLLHGAPRSERRDFFPSAASAVYADLETKSRALAARGAVGLVVVLTPDVEKDLPWPFFVRQAPFEKMTWMEGATPGKGMVLPSARLPSSALRRLLAKTDHTPEEIFAAGPVGKLKSFPLGRRARLRIGATVRTLTSENVVGVLKGAERSGEHVVVTAHLDHLGVGPPIGGDSIYNGAHDDASGVAGILEIARAFAALPKRPPRSVLVVGVTGEERGLLGSDYFARRPTVPLASIVANVNLDGPNGAWEPHDLIVLGADHSTLGDAARSAASALGLRLSPDPQPEAVHFIRSDQYSFVRRGVPSLFPGVGFADAQGRTEENRARDAWWVKNSYHLPSDEWDPSLDYEWMAKEVRADFLMTLAVALDPERPRWHDGDVFAQLFGAR